MAVKSFEKQACYAIKMSQDFPPLNKLKEMLENLKVTEGCQGHISFSTLYLDFVVTF